MNRLRLGKILVVMVAVLGIVGIAYEVGLRSRGLVSGDGSFLPREQSSVSELQQEQKEKSMSKADLVDWSAVQFDACGGEDTYNQLPWWSAFAQQVEQVNYYSDAYIGYQLKAASENEYSNPSKKQYTYETYCADSNYTDTLICGGNTKKVSVYDFTESGEGCLSKDGTGFIAVFPGEYMGGGNYIFRYDVKNNTLETAEKINEKEAYGSFWIDPPSSFGKRQGTMVAMTGGGGDAGCGSKTEFTYDLVANVVKMTRRCTSCDQEKPTCQVY